MAATAYIALGSNLGDRRDYLDRALAALQEKPGIVVTQVSSYLETAPVGGPSGQGDFLNAAAELQTELEAGELMRVLLDVERDLGRVRSERYGPRIIDLDVLLYDDLVCDEPDLVIPHPRLHERLFVLEPLAEIAPQARHPVMKRSIADLCSQLRQSSPSSAAAPGQPATPSVQTEGALASRELAGLRALVTGSTSGIGRAIAVELARGGSDVLVHGRRSQEAADAVVAEIRAQGVSSRPILADVTKQEDVLRLIETAWDAGPLDIWINNAGADTLTGEAARWPFVRKLDELLAVDVRATMLLARAVGRRMREAGRGAIVNIGWDQADTGMEGDSGELFAATKAAVMAFSKSLALSLAPQVRVNCVAPGWVRTAWGETASSRWQERVARETPLRRWGTPQDVAATVRWLVSPAAAFITGQVIRVNGGAVR